MSSTVLLRSPPNGRRWTLKAFTVFANRTRRLSTKVIEMKRLLAESRIEAEVQKTASNKLLAKSVGLKVRVARLHRHDPNARVRGVVPHCRVRSPQCLVLSTRRNPCCTSLSVSTYMAVQVDGPTRRLQRKGMPQQSLPPGWLSDFMDTAQTAVARPVSAQARQDSCTAAAMGSATAAR